MSPSAHRIAVLAVVVSMTCGVAGPALAEEAPPAVDAADPGVLRYKGVEIVPDIKLHSDYQIDVSDEELSNAFHVTRAYLGMKLKVTPWLSARVTYDITTVKDIGASGDYSVVDDGVSVSDSKLTGALVGRLKYAYVNVGILPIDANLRVGVVHTPWLGWIDHIEGTRFLRKAMWEKEYHYPSADFGVAFIGHAGDVLAYHVGVYNGEGYYGLDQIGFKDVAGRLSMRPAPHHKVLQGLQISAYAHGEFPLEDGEETDRRLGGAVTWRIADKIKDADCHKVEGDKAAFWFQIKSGQHGDPADHLANNLGMSFGARVELPAHLFVIGRGDRFDPDLDVDDDEYWRAIAAFGVRAHKTFRVALAYQGELPAVGDAQHLIGIHTEFRL